MRVGGLLVRLGRYSYHRGIVLLRDYYDHNSTAAELDGAEFQPASAPKIMINTGSMSPAEASAAVGEYLARRRGQVARWA